MTTTTRMTTPRKTALVTKGSGNRIGLGMFLMPSVPPVRSWSCTKKMRMISARPRVAMAR